MQKYQGKQIQKNIEAEQKKREVLEEKRRQKEAPQQDANEQDTIEAEKQA